MDWVDELAGAETVEPISVALTAILRIGESYLEAPAAWRGLAAAEVVAALISKPAAKLPPEIASWIRGRKPPNDGLVKEARQVVSRILQDSELRDLWADSKDAGLSWRLEVEDLLRRLRVLPTKDERAGG